MITMAVHEVTGATEPGGVLLALAVANELHAPMRRRVRTRPQPRPRTRPRVARAPEVAVPQVAVPQLMGLRMTAARPHRRKVPLSRLTAVMG
ncbi:hypothetical protein SY2F82_47080 [Streptomyces sp. Y2F8-2]|uniref:hypothetical protein n=1 Tax=unclassified Streptomyces TaxID=2593676 RepID=UPI0019061E6B|nr:hypothetical protein [Streptomyces sp. Y2F8-2]GHK02911.1 hypothetical protein SY2F82_47080 [Streptomyces sp. Y2F8-2]